MTRYCQKEILCKLYFIHKLRNNLRELINKVCIDVDEYIITTKDDKSAILISYEEYSSMKETIYLFIFKTIEID